MNYFADSAWDYLSAKMAALRYADPSQRLLVTVPSLTEASILALGETLQNRCNANGVALTFKVAEAVTRDWSPAGLRIAVSHGWPGSVTQARNAESPVGATNLVVLCGADVVTDAGSLADFHRCDPDTIWREQMQGSFRPWVRRKLEESGLSAEGADLRDFDRLLVPLIEYGRADLLCIGDWLASLDLRTVNDVREVPKRMLAELARFQLPSFVKLSLRRKRPTFGHLVDQAIRFFSYTTFLDARERDKALKAVRCMQGEMQRGADLPVDLEDPEIRAGYQDGAAFLEGLRRYIEHEDASDRTRLMTCDFVTIAEEILKFRVRKRVDRPTPLRRLTGSPVEVALHAVWFAIREFRRDREYDDAEIVSIGIKADQFKHHYEDAGDAEEPDAAIDQEERAAKYLARLLGGVDALVAKRAVVAGPSDEPVEIECALTTAASYPYARTAEPQLEFSVELRLDRGARFRRGFAWRLPEIQAYRVADAMIGWANRALDVDASVWMLPVFHVPYYQELLRAADDEETRRVLVHCLREARSGEPTASNLLRPEWLSSQDPMLPQLKGLAERYRQFLSAADDRGLHDALFSSEWTDLRQAYAGACRFVTEDEAGAASQMTAMLLRCFLLLSRRGPEAGPAWGAEPFEASAVVTVLHPAVLEMLESQIVYLFSCFNVALASERDRLNRRAAYAEKTWSGYVDLASIHAPLVGLLCDINQNLDTSVRGQDLIHRIGSPADETAALSTRVLVRYDAGVDDEEVADAEMFRESRESKLLFRLMMDYFRLHPHARDGLNLAVFRNEDIQPVIAAVHQYLNALGNDRDPRYYVLSPNRRKPYALGVTLFTETGDDAGVARWVEQWRERWEAAETEAKFESYRRCRFSVAHRLVDAGDLLGFQRLISDSFETDIAVLYDFVGAGRGGNRFAEVTPFDLTGRTLKFPILEKACCAVKHPVDSYKRFRVISNRQFTLGDLHAQVMHRLKNPGVQPGREFVVLGAGDFSPWRWVVDAMHGKAEWVVCIDPSIDERLIRTPAGGAREREIIGFGSGVGSHGEDNFTVSTEQFSLDDVEARLAASIREVYGGAGWAAEEWRPVANGVLRQAGELSGLSLVRATGVGNYIREFMAYALTRKMLRERGPLLCDNMVSLDAYRHWFDLAESERRPDLLWLTARLDENSRVCINAQLIECKLAGKSDDHLLKARAQITNGLCVLTAAFEPRDPAGPEDHRPDQRYWWLQLHRLIATKTEIAANRQTDVLTALERLAEGDYAIQWGASVFAFWSDDRGDEPVKAGSWRVAEADGLVASVYEMGSQFVRRLAVAEPSVAKTWAEWEAAARRQDVNVCDALTDVELPPDQDDDEDAPPWIEEDQGNGDEREADEVESTEVGQVPETETGQPEVPVEQVQPDLKPAQTAAGPEDVGGGGSQTAALAVSPAILPVATEAVAVSVPAIPDRVLLGKTVSGGRPVFWEFGHRELANRHMLVFGTSGMGKTYALQCLLSELGRMNQNSLIIDYTDGFIPSKLEEATKECLKPEQHFIRQHPLPISPFKAQVVEEAGMTFRDVPSTIAKRVAAIFKSVYELGNQQFPVLIDAITQGLEQHGDGFTLTQLLEVLQAYVGDDIHATGPVRTTIAKLKPFIQSNPFTENQDGVGWQQLFSDPTSRCHVFQFFMVDRHSARALIEFVLWDLYAFVAAGGNKRTPRVVVLDEVQNLDLGPDAPVSKYLTEGRKHGLSLLTATQTVRGVGGVNDARVSRLFQAEQKLFFKPTENEMREHAQLLYNAVSTVSVQEWATRLASLQLGECWALGRGLNESTGRLALQAHRIKISSLEERGFRA